MDDKQGRDREHQKRPFVKRDAGAVNVLIEPIWTIVSDRATVLLVSCERITRG